MVNVGNERPASANGSPGTDIGFHIVLNNAPYSTEHEVVFLTLGESAQYGRAEIGFHRVLNNAPGCPVMQNST